MGNESGQEVMGDDAARYRTLRLWHPRLEIRYWSGQCWEPLTGALLDAVLDNLARPTTDDAHAPQVCEAINDR